MLFSELMTCVSIWCSVSLWRVFPYVVQWAYDVCFHICCSVSLWHGWKHQTNASHMVHHYQCGKHPPIWWEQKTSYQSTRCMGNTLKRLMSCSLAYKHRLENISQMPNFKLESPYQQCTENSVCFCILKPRPWVNLSMPCMIYNGFFCVSKLESEFEILNPQIDDPIQWK